MAGRDAADENPEEEFTKAHNTDPAPPLERYFRTLKEGAATQNIHTIIDGVNMFIQLANLPTEKRTENYGHQFKGLHFASDLSSIWNKNHYNKLTKAMLWSCCPCTWTYDCQGPYQYLLYKGKKPSQGLNELMHGPTVVDCGMFDQLSFWFGWRYHLSDEVFDEVFGATPFYITTSLYQAVDPEHPFLGNPQFGFFDSYQQVSQPPRDSLEIVHIANDPKYSVKHPGGNSQGENCIIINGVYTIFGPQHPKKAFVDQRAVENFLLQKYNAPQNQDDQVMLDGFNAEPDTHHIRSNCSFATLVRYAHDWKDHQLTEVDWENHRFQRAVQERRLVFNYEKFSHWVSQRRQTTPPPSI